MRLVSPEEARRIAVRSQLLDGSASSVLDTVRRLGFLQIDPISTVAPPQHLVLFSRLGSSYDPAELDRLLWEEKQLFEYVAFIRPMEDLPLIHARMRRRRGNKYAHERRGNEFLKANARYKRAVLRELEQSGPLLSREIAGSAVRTWTSHGWYGNRNVAVLLEILHGRGVVAVVGRRNGQRLWDLAERWYPEIEPVPGREAEQILAERRFRAQGVRLTKKGWEAHPDATDGPVPDRATLLSPFDRLDPRPRPRRGAVGLPLPPRDVRAEGEARVRLLRAAAARRRPTRRPRRAGLRPQDEDTRAARRLGRHVPPGRGPARPRDVAGRGYHPLMDFETRAIHEGQEPDPATGSVTVPIYQTSTYAQEEVGVHKGYDYSRVANPTRTALQTCLASLEGADHGIAFSSGLGATTTIMHLVSPGERVVSVNDVYGGVYRMFSQVYEPKGYAFEYVTSQEMSTNLAAHLDERTRLVWIETPTNPTLNIVDIRAAAAAAHEAGALVVVDNTFATPYLQQPLELGADIVVHSLTKYLGGHSDLIGGFAATNDPTVAERLVFLQKSLGAVPGPFDCWLVLRGLKTLAVRMEKHCANARAVVEFLQGHELVEQVLYPGLAEPPRPRDRGAPDA